MESTHEGMKEGGVNLKDLFIYLCELWKNNSFVKWSVEYTVIYIILVYALNSVYSDSVNFLYFTQNITGKKVDGKSKTKFPFACLSSDLVKSLQYLLLQMCSSHSAVIIAHCEYY